MTGKDSTTARSERSILDLAFTGCAFAVAMGCLDIITSMLRIPAAFHSFFFVLLPLAATTVAAALLVVVIALVFAVLEKVLRLRVSAYMPVLLVFVAVLFALAGPGDLLPLSVLGVNVSMGDYLFRAGLMTRLALPQPLAFTWP